VDAETNSVGAEYMVMEVALGVPLDSLWNKMDKSQQVKCTYSIRKMAKELYSLEFFSFGSLYFNTPERPAGAIPLDKWYCIGPNCARQHWGYDQEKGVHSDMLEGHQGPCKSTGSQITYR
jgi:hypothetical protein